MIINKKDIEKYRALFSYYLDPILIERIIAHMINHDHVKIRSRKEVSKLNASESFWNNFYWRETKEGDAYWRKIQSDFLPTIQNGVNIKLKDIKLIE